MSLGSHGLPGEQAVSLFHLSVWSYSFKPFFLMHSCPVLYIDSRTIYCRFQWWSSRCKINNMGERAGLPSYHPCGDMGFYGGYHLVGAFEAGV